MRPEPEIPLEITHVRPHLLNLFNGQLPEATSGTEEERERNFLSRALAAFAVHKHSGCSIEEATKSIVDGGGDGGIDAFYYSPTADKLWIVQSKYHSDGRGEPSLGDMAKFKLGLENLLQGRFDEFNSNSAWKLITPKLPSLFANSNLKICAIVVYSSISYMSDDRNTLFEDLKIRFSPDSDYLSFQFNNLTTIHDWVTGADDGLGVEEISLTIKKPGWIRTPYETIYGLVQLSELHELFRAHGKKLIEANIRAYKGNTIVNENIVSTIRKEPENFFYLNNGLTAYCQKIEINNTERANHEQKTIRAFGFSIVNGAQTLGSITKFASESDLSSEGYAFLKIISLQRCDDEREFAKRITKSTNFQNQIGIQDFISQDEQHERIANQLSPSSIYYHYKDDVDTPPSDEENFDIREALTACTCLANLSDCDFCARILSNRKSLWSMDEEPNGSRSRYARIFPPERSARTVWRAVQIQRVVIDALKSTELGARKDFFVNCRWVILSTIFLKQYPERGNNLALTAEEKSTLTATAQDYAEKLWTASLLQGFVSARSGGGWESPRHFASIFSSANDCASLRNGLLNLLNTSPSAEIITSSQTSESGKVE
jgi:hypothetical protein